VSFATVISIRQLSFQKFPNIPTIFIALKRFKMSVTSLYYSESQSAKKKHRVCICHHYSISSSRISCCCNSSRM